MAADTKWTDDQRKVIDVRDKNVLVAAAAGSGKTAVLVEHIISLVTGENGQPPVDIDKLLVVTFTNAAASEMRERILKALEKKMKDNPFDDHIRKQLTYIHNAKIATIDSFCKDVVKEHFNEIDIDPAFKIADSGDLALMQSDVMAELLEKNYAEGTESFHRFIDVYSDSRSDKAIEEKLLTLYRFSQSYPNPEKWLWSLVEAYEIEPEKAEGSCSWFQVAKDNIRMQLSQCIAQAETALELSYDSGLDKLPDFIKEEYDRLKRLGEQSEFDAMGAGIKGFTFGRFPTLKGLSEEDTLTKDVIKNLRTSYKKGMESLAKKYFLRPLNDILEDVRKCAPVVRELVRLVTEFGRAYKAAKLEKDMTDFSDIEHYALDILAREDENGHYVPTETAIEMSQDYYEIMIDEYQDSNLVQEIILNAISKRGNGTSNVFMVGDVKQSIYKFRLARPELFLKKYDTYPAGCSDSTDVLQPVGNNKDCQKIVLSKNFRSRYQVLDFCNAIFRQIMVKDLGGIAYDEDNMLYPGMEFPVDGEEYKAEIMFVDMDDDGEEEDGLSDDEAPAKVELEAAMTAAKIKELIYGNGKKEPLMIYDKEQKEMRPLRFGDIAILFRSTKAYADAYAEAFMAEGIPVYTSLSEGYFDTFEISAILDMLSVIDNPRQDIKLAAVLKNIFGITENMLADIKIDKACSFHQAFLEYDGVYANKINIIKNKLSAYRKASTYMSIYDIICMLLEDTHFKEFLMASKAGEKRMANVEMLLQKAKAYEDGAYSGLFNFVRYIELMKKYKVEQGEANVSGENEDSVKLMTIHKSKGLEYPVVFVAGMGKKMNMADVTKDMIIHHELGVGLNCVDTDRRVKYKTLIKETIAYKIKLENLAEELRVLYVALTRAREKLILTGVGRVTKKLDDYESLAKRGRIELDAMTVAGAVSYMDWIMMATANEYAGKHVLFNRVRPGDIVYSKVETAKIQESSKEALAKWDCHKVYDGNIRKYLEDTLTYIYEHDEECRIRSKMSISDIKHMFMRMTADDDFPSEEINFGEPGEKGPSKGALRGTAYHRVFELFDYDNVPDDKSNVSAMMDSMVEKGLLDEESKELVDASKILVFAKSDLGRRMACAHKNRLLYREKPFVMGIPACAIDKDKYKSEELVVVQGIVDAWFEEDEGIVIVDYKTDNVARIEDLKARYESQLVYYGEALEKVTGKPVKELVIYSVKFGESLSL